MQDQNLDKLRLEITEIYQDIREKNINKSRSSPSTVSAPLSPDVGMPPLLYSGEPVLDKLKMHQEGIKSNSCASPVNSKSGISAPLNLDSGMPPLLYSEEPVLGKPKEHKNSTNINPCASPIHAKPGFFSSMLQESPKTPPRVEKRAPSSPYSPIGPSHR